MLVSEPEPRDARLLKHVRKHLERFHRPVARKPEPSHPRLLAPRRCLISDAEVAVISSALGYGAIHDAPIAAWQRDTCILWARELIELEIKEGALTHMQSHDARAIEALGYVSGGLTGQRVEGSGHSTPSQTGPS